MKTNAWINKTCRFAQTEIPQAPASTPPPMQQTPTQQPVSARPQPQPQQKPKTIDPMTVENCSVSFQDGHLIVNSSEFPAITLTLTEEQNAAVQSRLSQKQIPNPTRPTQ